MRKTMRIAAGAAALLVSLSANAQIILIGGEGYSADFNTALEHAAAQAFANCTVKQGGTPIGPARLYDWESFGVTWRVVAVVDCDVP